MYCSCTMDSSRAPVVFDLQDINPNYNYQAPPETRTYSGGFSYTSAQLPSRHRFLYWHCRGKVLEVREHSLDLELTGACARFQFAAPIFSNVVPEEINADDNNGPFVCLNFVLADGTLWRLGFTHPDATLLPHARVPGSSYPSVLVEPPKTWQLPTGLTPTAMCGSGDMLVVAATDGTLILHFLPVISGLHRNEPYDCVQLYNKNIAQRIIAGLTPQIFKPMSAVDSVMALCCLKDERWCTAFTLSAGLELKAHRLLRGDEHETRAVSVLSLRDYIDDPAISAMNLQGDRHELRICDASNTKLGTSYIAAYVASSVQSIVMVFECKWPLGVQAPVVQHMGNKLGIPGNLVDFSIQDEHLWFLVDDSGTPSVFHGSVTGDAAAPSQLANVPPSLTVKGEVLVPLDKSVREVYSAYIFHRNLFSQYVIAEAVSVFSSSQAEFDSFDNLKAAATRAVEAKIKSQSLRVDADVRELEIRCWHELLQSCLHFWTVENAVQGVFRDASMGLAYVVKDKGIELVRATGGLTGAEHGADVARLLDCMDIAKELFGSDSSKHMFANPHQYCSVRASEVVLNSSTGRDIAGTFASKISGIVELPAAVRAVLDTLGDLDDQAAGRNIFNFEERVDLLSSQYGIKVLADSICEYVESRLERARSLLLALALVFRLRHQADISSEERAVLSQNSLPLAVQRFQELYVLHWVATTPASVVTDASIEVSIRHLHIIGDTYTPPSPLSSAAASILELFLSESDNLRELQGVASLDEDSSVLDEMTFGAIPYIRAKDRDGRLSPNVNFCRFLLQRCQLEQLHEYILLLGRDSAPSAFMMAQIQLRNGEFHKAKVNFLRAVNAVEPDHDEAPVFRRLVGLTDEEGQTGTLSKAAYYVKVMEFFKESIPRSSNALDEMSKPAVFNRLHSPHIVISFARAGLRSIPQTAATPGAAPLISMFWATIFQYSLDLGDNDGAYAAAVANPDPDIRGDCIGRLVGVLCERGDSQAVVRFPYVGAQDQVLDVLKTKAKNLDMLAVFLDDSPRTSQRNVNYYRVLYSFHVHRSDYHAAGVAMFECATRLEIEYQFQNSDGAGMERCARLLTHQRDALLASINVLHLVDEDKAWLVRRREPSKKRRRHDTGADPNSLTVEVLAIRELQQEYVLAQARIELLKDENVDSTRVMSKAFTEVDAISMLVGQGKFDLVFALIKLSPDGLDPAIQSEVFSSLAERCARLTIDPNVEHSWLNFNDIDLGPATPPVLGGGDPLDEQNTSPHAADRSWEFLRLLLRLYDSGPENNYQLHVDVVDRIMSLHISRSNDSGDSYVPIPKWLLGSLEKRNATALLRLYVKHDDLKQATALALSMVKTQIPRTDEDKKSLNRWLPYTELDALLAKLRSQENSGKGRGIAADYRTLEQILVQQTSYYMSKLEQSSGVDIPFR